MGRLPIPPGTTIWTKHSKIGSAKGLLVGKAVLDALLARKAELEAVLSRIDVWLLVFGIIVVIGVAGESFFGIRHWWNSRKLQALEHGVDQERQAEIAGLITQAEEARKAAAKANEQAAEANEKAEEERVARLKIEERLAPRRISPEEHQRLVAALSPYRGSSVQMTKLGDLEAGRFADDISLVFHESGWNVTLNYAGIVAPPVYNLRCVVNESASGKALGAALKNLPSAEVQYSPDLPVAGRIFVGLKPPH
jgi:hypothetical protein